MNSVSNGFAPFQIDVNYLKPEDKGGAMDFQTVPCNETVPGGDGKYFQCIAETAPVVMVMCNVANDTYIPNSVHIVYYSTT